MRRRVTLPGEMRRGGGDGALVNRQIERTRAGTVDDIDIVNCSRSEYPGIAVARVLVEPEEGHTFHTMDGVEAGVAVGPSGIKTPVGDTVEVVDTAPRRGDTSVGGHYGDRRVNQEHHQTIVSVGYSTAHFVAE